MPYPMNVLVNDFALRCFRETADKDYIAARMAYRARLIQPFLWSALHCMEKYIKGILLLNRVKAHKGHSISPGILAMKKHGKFELELETHTIEFIQRLEDGGAEFRYYETSYHIQTFDLVRFDNAVWELRRYCQPLDYDFTDLNGKTENHLDLELARIRKDKANNVKGTSIIGGYLEKVIAEKHHPAREPLLWKNLRFGTSKRKSVKMRPEWEAGNSPIFLHPEVVAEVAKYVYIPSPIQKGAEVLVQQRAAEAKKRAAEERRAAKKAALGNKTP